MLTKTNVEAFNVKPKSRSIGPCTCSVDVNVSDTIRNIFEQVDIEQRKMAEHTYLKYIANKILNGNLDVRIISIFHYYDLLSTLAVVTYVSFLWGKTLKSLYCNFRETS